MRDIILKAEWIKRELSIFVVCLILAIALNIYSIIKYKTNWIELITMLHVTILLTIVFYIISSVYRTIAYFISTRKNKKSNDE